MPYNEKMEKRIYVKVSKRLLEDFDKACEANHRTRSEILRRAMLKYVRETKKRKDQENEKDRSSRRSKSRLLEQIGEF